jgi:hypothetical protein
MPAGEPFEAAPQLAEVEAAEPGASRGAAAVGARVTSWHVSED